MQIVSEIAALLSRFLYVIVVYRTGVVIHGLPPDYILLYMGTYFIMTGIYVFFFVNNFWAFQHHVRNGTLDLFIVKPVSLQFIVSTRLINFGMSIPDFILGVALVVWGWQRLGLPVDFYHVGGYLVFIIGGAFLIYALFMFPQVLAFWFVNTANLYNIGAEMWESNTMPMGIFNKAIKTIGIFIMPIFLISNFSPLFVVGKLSTTQIIWGLIAPVLGMVFIRILFKLGLRKYTSSGS